VLYRRWCLSLTIKQIHKEKEIILEQQVRTPEDTIDIRELIETIKKRKTLIYAITGVMTLLAVLYAFVLAKPVYEVKAMIEIGKIEAGTKDEKTLDDLVDVKQKLEYTYGVKSKKQQALPRVKSISIAKNSKGIFSIVVEGRDNDSTIEHIKKVVYKLENDYAQKIKAYTDTKKELIELTQKDIKETQNNLIDIGKTLKNYNQKVLSITEKDAALAGLYTIQISQNQARLQELQSRISELKTKEFKLKLSLSPLRITQTHIVGEVESLDKPIKPKKALIIIVAFITALMFSIFLVFFLEFLRGMKEEV